MRKTKAKPVVNPKRTLAAAAAAMVTAQVREETASRPRRAPAKPKPRTREGKKGLVLYVEPEITVAIRQLALTHGTDVQTLGREALHLLFATYGAALPGHATPSRT